MTLDEINSKEAKKNEAFKRWIGDSSQFFNLPIHQQQMLIDYVSSLHAEIADLESDLHRK